MNYEPLINVLSEEIKIYDEIIEVEKKKTVAIASGKVEDLDAILNEEQMYGMKINSIEKRRIGVSDGLGIGGKSLLDVVREAKNPEKTKLYRLYQKLIKSVETVKQINEYNIKLVHGRLEVINDINDAIHSSGRNKKNDMKRTYTKDAKVTEDHSGVNVIKKKI